jgi:hypothetical protein
MFSNQKIVIEQLEDRTLLSGSASGISASKPASDLGKLASDDSAPDAKGDLMIGGGAFPPLQPDENALHVALKALAERFADRT